MALTPSQVRRKLIAAITAIALPVAESATPFVQLAGVFTDLVQCQGDRVFICVARQGSTSTPERGIGANESTIDLELTIAYQLTENTDDRMLDDSARVKRAIERLDQSDGIQKKEIEPLPFDFGTVPNGVLAIWLIKIRYFETSEV